MANEFIAEALKMIGGAVVGALATAASVVPYYNSKIAALTTEVRAMKESCTTCKSSVDKSLTDLNKVVTDHHNDDTKHTSPAAITLLEDILKRVMRVESRMFNGHQTE